MTKYTLSKIILYVYAVAAVIVLIVACILDQTVLIGFGLILAVVIFAWAITTYEGSKGPTDCTWDDGGPPLPTPPITRDPGKTHY